MSKGCKNTLISQMEMVGADKMEGGGAYLQYLGTT